MKYQKIDLKELLQDVIIKTIIFGFILILIKVFSGGF